MSERGARDNDILLSKNEAFNENKQFNSYQ